MRISSFKNPNVYDGNYKIEIEAYYFTNWKNYNMDFHCHNRIELMYVSNGSCVIEVDNKEIKLKQNEFIVIDANISHRLIATKCRMLNIEFSFVEIEELLYSIKNIAESHPNLLYLFDNDDFFYLKDINGIGETLKSLIGILCNEWSSELILQTYLIQLMVGLGNLLSLEKKETNIPNFHIAKAIEYINANYDCEINVEDMAKELKVSSSYLYRIFNHHLKCTPNNYLIEIRINKSKMLLKNSNYNLTQIAIFSGFSSLQYFSYIFKKHNGVSPKVYRENIKEIKF